MAEPIYKIDVLIPPIHRRRYKRRLFVAILAILLVIAAAIGIAYDIKHTSAEDNHKSVGATFTQTIAGPQTFRSAYFQFTDSSTWVYAANESTSNKLTYILYEAKLPAHSLTVYVNQTPLQSDLATTRVLPVKTVNGNSFSIGEISDPCSTLYKPTDPKSIHNVFLSGTNMLCVPDSPQYSVILGQIGGNYDLLLRRSDGELAQYIIIYNNLTVDPSPAPFLRIMQTFKAL